MTYIRNKATPKLLLTGMVTQLREQLLAAVTYQHSSHMHCNMTYVRNNKPGYQERRQASADKDDNAAWSATTGTPNLQHA